MLNDKSLRFFPINFLICGLSMLSFSCAAPTQYPSEPDGASVSKLEPLSGFKVLTYNVFHGLNVGKYWVSRGESPEHNQERVRLQVQELAEAQPDLIFLQEVNPLPERANKYVTALKGHGLDYTQVHQVDSCGWRLSKNIALIKELNNGLVILGKSGFVLQEIEGLKLSGSGVCHDTWGIQFGELRYALIGQITWPETHDTFLLVNVHLHSGIESDAHFLKELSDAHKNGRLQHYAQLKSELLNDQSTRLQELHVLSRELDKLIAHNDYAGVLIGGDFNFEKQSPEYQETVNLGAIDTATLVGQGKKISTIDPMRNTLAKEDAETIPDQLQTLIAEESSEDQQEVLADYRTHIERPRKVDFIFLLPIHPDIMPKKHCVKQEIFGLETDSSGLFGSDHFGVMNTYSFSGSPC